MTKQYRFGRTQALSRVYKKSVSGVRRGTAARRAVHVPLRVKTALATRTKTLTKSKLKGSVTMDGPVSTSFNKIYLKGAHKMPRNFKRLFGLQTYVSDNTVRSSWTLGQQGISVVGYHFSAGDLSGMMTQASALLATGPAAVGNWKIQLESLTSQILFTNQTNDVVNVKFYDIVCRRPTNNASYRDPALAWAQGMIDANSSGIQARAGSTPFQCAAVTNFYRIQRVTTIQVHSGGHHKHVVKINPQKIFNEEEFLGITNGSVQVADLMCYTVAVLHGYPSNDVGTNITLASGAGDFAITKEYRWRMLGEGISYVKAGTTSFASTASQGIINDLTGVTTTVLNI